MKHISSLLKLFQKLKSEQFQTTPNKNASKPKPKQNVFGIDLKDLLPSAVIIDPENQLQVPHFLKATLNYLQDHLDTEGLFRKAGSKRNQRILRNEIEEAESFCIDTSDQGNLLRGRPQTFAIFLHSCDFFFPWEILFGTSFMLLS